MDVKTEQLSLPVLQRLVAVRESPCVSLLIPLEKGKWDERQARLELKNLIAHARDVLSVKRHSLETDVLLAPGEAFLRPGANWTGLGGGLGLFLSPTFSLVVHLPTPAGPTVMVGDRFDVLPLLPLVIPDYAFHVLTLSQHHLKLFRGTRFTFERVRHPDLPASMEDALWFERHENVLVARGGPRQGSGPRAASIVHGGQTWADEKRDMIERYVQMVDNVVDPIIRGHGELLVLASVEREAASYRAASHSILADGEILGNPDLLSEEQLHTQAWTIVAAERQDAELRRVLERFGEATGTTRRSVDPDEMVEGASSGRIEMLLLPGCEPYRHTEPRVGGGVESFVNGVVGDTLTHGGSIVFVPADALPDGVVAGALFRWD